MWWLMFGGGGGVGSAVGAWGAARYRGGLRVCRDERVGVNGFGKGGGVFECEECIWRPGRCPEGYSAFYLILKNA